MLNFMSVDGSKQNQNECMAKIRYNHKGALVCDREDRRRMKWSVHLMNHRRAVTPGQAVVLYDGEYVLGGGNDYR